MWGLVGGFALLLGAVIGLAVRASQRVIGIVMAFGSGALISAVSFDLTEEAFRRAGLDAVAVGLAAGSIAFFAADWVVDRRGGKDRKRSGGQQEEGTALAIVIGSVMDGIPESIAIGISLIEGGSVAVPILIAVFLSNVPESLSAATGLRKAGHSTRYVLSLWTGVMLVSAAAAAAGHALLGQAPADVVASIQAFAAGAILTMLADTMMPEAFHHGGSVVGLITVLGFAFAFFVSRLA